MASELTQEEIDALLKGAAERARKAVEPQQESQSQIIKEMKKDGFSEEEIDLAVRMYKLEEQEESGPAHTPIPPESKDIQNVIPVAEPPSGSQIQSAEAHLSKEEIDASLSRAEEIGREASEKYNKSGQIKSAPEPAQPVPLQTSQPAPQPEYTALDEALAVMSYPAGKRLKEYVDSGKAPSAPEKDINSRLLTGRTLVLTRDVERIEAQFQETPLETLVSTPTQAPQPAQPVQTATPTQPIPPQSPSVSIPPPQYDLQGQVSILVQTLVPLLVEEKFKQNLGEYVTNTSLEETLKNLPQQAKEVAEALKNDPTFYETFKAKVANEVMEKFPDLLGKMLPEDVRAYFQSDEFNEKLEERLEHYVQTHVDKIEQQIEQKLSNLGLTKERREQLVDIIEKSVATLNRTERVEDKTTKLISRLNDLLAKSIKGVDTIGEKNLRDMDAKKAESDTQKEEMDNIYNEFMDIKTNLYEAIDRDRQERAENLAEVKRRSFYARFGRKGYIAATIIGIIGSSLFKSCNYKFRVEQRDMDRNGKLDIVQHETPALLKYILLGKERERKTIYDNGETDKERRTRLSKDPRTSRYYRQGSD